MLIRTGQKWHRSLVRTDISVALWEPAAHISVDSHLLSRFLSISVICLIWSQPHFLLYYFCLLHIYFTPKQTTPCTECLRWYVHISMLHRQRQLHSSGPEREGFPFPEWVTYGCCMVPCICVGQGLAACAAPDCALVPSDKKIFKKIKNHMTLCDLPSENTLHPSCPLLQMDGWRGTASSSPSRELQLWTGWHWLWDQARARSLPVKITAEPFPLHRRNGVLKGESEIRVFTLSFTILLIQHNSHLHWFSVQICAPTSTINLRTFSSYPEETVPILS